MPTVLEQVVILPIPSVAVQVIILVPGLYDPLALFPLPVLEVAPEMTYEMDGVPQLSVAVKAGTV
jgi:hypothetical protein